MGGVLASEEHSLPTESKPTDTKWEFFVDGAIHRALERMAVRIEVAVASMRGQEPTSQPLTAKDLERFIQRVGSGHSVHIQNSGRSGPPKWLNKFILGVGIALAVSAVTATATVIVTVASLSTKIDDYIKSNDQRVTGVEERLHDAERRLDRGASLSEPSTIQKAGSTTRY